MRGEWDELKQHDVVFLATVRPPDEVALAALRESGAEPTPADLYGLVYVRGAEVVEVRAPRCTAFAGAAIKLSKPPNLLLGACIGLCLQLSFCRCAWCLIDLWTSGDTQPAALWGAEGMTGLARGFVLTRPACCEHMRSNRRGTACVRAGEG